MIRFGLIALLLGSCAPTPKPASVQIVMMTPNIPRDCRAPAPAPKPLPPLHTLDQLKIWSEAEGKAHAADRASLIECNRRLGEALDAFDALQAQINGTPAAR